MGKHKSVEARRLTELGQGLYAWSNVLFNGCSVYDSSAKPAMRELALMEDTAENRELLQKAAYRCGLPESEAESLATWVAGDDPLWNMMPKDCGYPFFSNQDTMKQELAEYVRGTWPEDGELVEALRDADALYGWHAKTRADGTTRFTKGRDSLVVGFGHAEDIALTCDDLDNPPIGLQLSLNGGEADLIMCGNADQAARILADMLDEL